ncbi:MAG TPA: 50S ribosomal protein L25 [Candidatus Angelobacter sp.]|nr:50S ribosomal protein L25 [Candidatus Angelobacter sp.]
MKSLSLKVFPRTLAKRTRVRKLRASGRVPAVIYGRQTRPQNLEVGLNEIEELIHHSVSETILVDLAIEGEAKSRRLALVQEIQHHPLSGKVLHVDFHEVAETEKVTVTVPVETAGEAAGVKTGGGVLEHVLFKLKVRALPKDLPEAITVDVTPLEIGQTIHLGEIPLPPGVEVIGDKKIPVISVAAPITEAQEAAALEAATTPLAEPEVLKEKKEEGAAEAAPGAGGKPAEKGAKPAEKGGEKAAEKPADKAEKKPEKKK